MITTNNVCSTLSSQSIEEDINEDDISLSTEEDANADDFLFRSSLIIEYMY